MGGGGEGGGGDVESIDGTIGVGGGVSYLDKRKGVRKEEKKRGGKKGGERVERITFISPTKDSPLMARMG